MARCPMVCTVDVHQLAALVRNRIDNTLILDSRSFLEYNASHILNAINVGCAKLMKRRLQQEKLSIEDFLAQNCHWNVDRNVDIIVYDQNTHDPKYLSSDSFMGVFLQKLQTVYKSISVLKGGFLEFQASYPHLCEDERAKCGPLTSLSQPCLPISNHGPTRILPFLYLGSQNDALSKEVMQLHNITYQLNVSTNCPKPDFIQESHFMRIPVIDNYSEKLLPYFPKAFLFLDKVREAGGCALVHCLAGISRSATVAIAYVMRHLQMTSDEAYRYVKAKRGTISPNFNFLGQLLEYEKQLQKDRILFKSEVSSASNFNNPSSPLRHRDTYDSTQTYCFKYGDIKTSTHQVSTYELSSQCYISYEQSSSNRCDNIPDNNNRQVPSPLSVKYLPLVSSLKELNFTPCQASCNKSPTYPFLRVDNIKCGSPLTKKCSPSTLVSPFGLSPDFKTFEFGNKAFSRTDSTSTSGLGSEEGSSDFTDSWNDSSYERETDILMDEDYSPVPSTDEEEGQRKSGRMFEDSFDDSLSLYQKFELQYPPRRLRSKVGEMSLHAVPNSSNKKHTKHKDPSPSPTKQRCSNTDDLGRAHLLYRAQSCPGMISSESEDGSISPDCFSPSTGRVKLRQASSARNKPPKNRYSCSSIDYMVCQVNEDGKEVSGSTERVCNYRHSMIQVS